MKPKEGWLTVLLPWVFVLLTALTIREAELVRNYALFPMLVLTGSLGFLAGLALAKSQFPELTAHIYSLVYGLFTFGVVIGRTMPGDLDWRERIANIVLRLADWVSQVFGGSSSRDSLIIVMYTTLIFWVLGYTAAWYTFRKPSIWRVVLPSGLVLLSVVYYYFGPRPLFIYLGLYTILALVYLSQTYLLASQQEWQRQYVRFSGHIGGAFVRSSFVIAVVALAVAWALPSLAASPSVSDAVTQVNKPWREFRDWWQRGFAALDSSYSQVQADPYEDTLVLGGPREVGDFPIMDVYVERRLPYAYWRKEVLDTYDPANRRWESVEGDTEVHFPEDGALNVPPTNGRSQISQIFVNYIPNAGTIYGAPDILNVDRQVLVKEEADPQGYRLISAVRARYSLQQGDRYEVVSNFSTADGDSLRNASVDYPAYIQERYLDVPEEISQRTIDLATRLAAPQNNPYDKALAIQNYLRQAITYNDQAEAPPPGVEAVDYLLFVSREGYCNYYASAMAIMLRSQGIPARLSRGYAAGEFNPDINAYRVRAKDAHTWVEAYFPEYGWISFEPTTSIPIVVRPDNPFATFDEAAEGLNPDDLLREDLADRLREESQDSSLTNGLDALGQSGPGLFNRAGGWLMMGAALAVAAGFVVVAAAERRSRRMEGDVVQSYNQLASWGAWVGAAIRPNHTPFERADILTAAVPEGASPIWRLVNEYALRTFSGQKYANPMFSSLAEWRRLRPALLRRAVLNRLPTWLARRLMAS